MFTILVIFLVCLSIRRRWLCKSVSIVMHTIRIKYVYLRSRLIKSAKKTNRFKEIYLIEITLKFIKLHFSYFQHVPFLHINFKSNHYYHESYNVQNKLAFCYEQWIPLIFTFNIFGNLFKYHYMHNCRKLKFC